MSTTTSSRVYSPLLIIDRVLFFRSQFALFSNEFFAYNELAVFQSFLTEFKTTTITEADARDALSNLNMDDEEDMDMNDTPGRRSTRSGGARRRTGRRPRAAVQEPKLKYMIQLQEIANRERDSITIELDDLKEVFLNKCGKTRQWRLTMSE
jgi:hypothetical protein